MNKKLYKSLGDKAISGVCGGIAEYFDIDVVIVRLLAVIFCFISLGTVLVAYIIASVIIPEEPVVQMGNGTKKKVYETTYEYRNEDGTVNGRGVSECEGAGHTDTSAGGAEFYESGREGEPCKSGGESRPKTKSSGTWIVGVLLIAMGAYMIVDWFFPWISWRIFGAIILITLGGVVLLKK